MTTTQDGAFVRRPLIAGNWKMNMDHIQAIALVQKLAWTLDDASHDYERVEVAVFPPFTDLRSVQTLVAGDKLSLVYGAQDLSPEDSGAYTGDILVVSSLSSAVRRCLLGTLNVARFTRRATMWSIARSRPLCATG